MIGIKIFANGGGNGASGFFFCILLYYFIIVIIKTLYINSVIVVHAIYFTHS